ncbi:MAG: spore coat protein U domain-containing protein [Rubrivivax sp.]
MKKTFRQAALAVSLGLGALAPSAFAATASSTFNVSLTLTPKCEFTGTIGALAVSYDSFQTAASTGSTNFAMRCTGGQAFSVALDGTGSYTDTTTNIGYSLKLSTNSSAPSGTDTTSVSGTGSGTTPQTYYVYANAAANQAGQGGGNGTTSIPGSTTRTLTITY